MIKLPISLTDDSDNIPSLAMSGFIAVAANALVYLGYRAVKSSKSQVRRRELKTAYAKYESKLEKINDYLRENIIFYESSLNSESKNLGLVIIEAYYGLADHIYQVEAGTLLYKIPTSDQEYAQQQVLPVTKQLQLQV